MFCKEPIRAVYVKTLDLWTEAAYSDYTEDLAYHFTGSFAMMMLTEREAIRFDGSGVSRSPLTQAIWDELKHDFDPCIEGEGTRKPWPLYEHTLFCGERIRSVEHREDTKETVVCFEDFTFRFVPHHSEDEFPRCTRDAVSYYRIRGCERHLRFPCPDCGGEGEILLDFGEDYLVRCRRCHRATMPRMFVQYAIDGWNAGKLDFAVEDERIANLLT